MIEAVIEAVSNLVSPTGKASSLCDEFDLVLVDAGRVRKFHEFKGRRFCAFGFAAAAILYHLADLEELLRRTNSNNFLVQAVRLYLQSDYVHAALLAVAKFTQNVTLPFLNFCEKASQSDCVKYFPGKFSFKC